MRNESFFEYTITQFEIDLSNVIKTCMIYVSLTEKSKGRVSKGYVWHESANTVTNSMNAL